MSCADRQLFTGAGVGDVAATAALGAGAVAEVDLLCAAFVSAGFGAAQFDDSAVADVTPP